MRLPKDPENWTGWHADKAIAEAWSAFRRYEDRIDFGFPQELQDAIYLPYRLARKTAVDVANYTNWRKAEAEKLP